jgi:hypothetical protein
MEAPATPAVVRKNERRENKFFSMLSTPIETILEGTLLLAPRGQPVKESDPRMSCRGQRRQDHVLTKSDSFG